MKATLATLCIAALAIASVPHASAASHTTLFNGPNRLANQLSFDTADDVQITVTAHANMHGYHYNPRITQAHDGLGAYSYGQDNSKLDGKYADETLWLNFDADYSIEKIIFSQVDSGDDVELFNALGQSLGRFNLTHASAVGQSTYLDLTHLDINTTKIGISAIDENDSFKLRGLVGRVVAVPTPSAAFAGILGLIGIAARRRRAA